ncbi:MAG: hypothetical protein FWH27_04005 [Planctomycetaceae bacterium]|nr:hypothetical protein [Planctomycetaceae bacterium]
MTPRSDRRENTDLRPIRVQRPFTTARFGTEVAYDAFGRAYQNPFGQGTRTDEVFVR